jgi:hypothetical protein
MDEKDRLMDTQVAAPDAHTIVTSTDDTGRTLSGVGVTTEALAEVMERRSPAEEAVGTSAPDAETQQQATPAAAPVKQTRGRERFSELAHQRDEAKQRAETLERELTEWKAKASQAPAAPAVASPPAPSSPSVPNGGDSGHSSTRPQPSEDEVGTKYKTYAEFVVDSARWVAEQQPFDIDARVRQSIEADRASRDFLAHAESTWAKGRKVYADFDALRTSGPGSQVPMDHAKIQAILHHPQSEHVQYAIVKDGALAQRLASMGPIEFGYALASLVPTAAAAPLASTARPGSQTPPAPVQPVGSGSPTTAPSISDLARQGDYQAYKAQRAADRQRRR